MAIWLCERVFEVTIEGTATVVPVRFPVEAPTEEEAGQLAEAAGAEAFRLLAGDGVPGVPAGPAVILYPT